MRKQTQVTKRRGPSAGMLALRSVPTCVAYVQRRMHPTYMSRLSTIPSAP